MFTQLSCRGSIMAGLLAVASPAARADDVTWLNAAGGDWNAAANWSTGTVPGDADTAIFGALSGPYSVRVTGTRTIGGIAMNSSNVTLQLEGNSTVGSASLTVNSSFTNVGVIELVSAGSTWTETLSVTSGTLINAPGAEIRISAGSGGSRTLAAAIDNQGAIELQHNCTINRSGAVHTNSGTINVAGGNLTLTLSSAGSSFTNTGDIMLASGSTLNVTGGTFNQTSGAITGTGSTIAISSNTFNLATDFTNGPQLLTTSSSTINGPGVITNTGTFTPVHSTINADFQNQTGALTRCLGSNTFAGAFTNAVGAMLELQGNSQVGSSLVTLENGLTNNGLIELVSTGSTWAETLTITGGTLINAPGAEIRISAGSGGARTLAAAIDNQGTIDVQHNCTLNRNGAVHVNSGTFNLAGGDLTLTLNGAASFSNTGDFVIGAGRTLSVTGGTFNQTSGLIGGSGSTISISSNTFNLATNFTNGPQLLTTSSSTINGPGVIINTGTFTPIHSTINADFQNQTGALTRCLGSNTFAGAFTNAVGATLELQGNSQVGSSLVTLENGLTNNGAIELVSTDSTWAETLTVTGGTLINAPGAEIRISAGSGGARTLAAAIDNQGTIEVQHTCTLNRSGAAHTNSGTINLAGGDLTLTLSGAASFSNTGDIMLASGRTLNVTGGTFNQTSGLIGGTGSTISISSNTFNLATNFTNGPQLLTTSSSTINGPGVITNIGTFTPVHSTINADFQNQAGALTRCLGSDTFAGAFTNAVGATLELQGNSQVGSSFVTLENGLTNNGLIELVSNGSTWAETLTVTGGPLINAPGAEIRISAGSGGARTLAAAVLNHGVVDVEARQLLSISGNYTQSDSGELNFYVVGLPPAEFSRVAITGAASLDGTIGVTLQNGYLPNLGDLYQIMTFGSLVDVIGCFDVAGLFFGTGLRYNLIRNPTNLMLEVVNTPVQPGDLRCDCTVDLVDLSILLANFGSTDADQSNGDLDNDRDVDLSDLSVLLSLFGTVCPEP